MSQILSTISPGPPQAVKPFPNRIGFGADKGKVHSEWRSHTPSRFTTLRRSRKGISWRSRVCFRDPAQKPLLGKLYKQQISSRRDRKKSKITRRHPGEAEHACERAKRQENSHCDSSKAGRDQRTAGAAAKRIPCSTDY